MGGRGSLFYFERNRKNYFFFFFISSCRGPLENPRIFSTHQTSTMADGDNPPAAQALAGAEEVAPAPAAPAPEAPAAAAEELKSAAPVAEEEASAPAAAAAPAAAPAPAAPAPAPAPAALEEKKEEPKVEPKEEPKEEPKKEAEGGVVVFAGGTDWSMVRERLRIDRTKQKTWGLLFSSSTSSLSHFLSVSLALSLSLPLPPPPPRPLPPPSPPPPDQIGRQCGAASKKASAEEQAAEADRQARYPSLPTPVRLAALDGVPVAFVAAGPSAVHCLVGAVDGRLFTWGRNEKGQLGHGETTFFFWFLTLSSSLWFREREIRLKKNLKKKKLTFLSLSSFSRPP